MNNMRNKILMTLALLLTAVTGAWAQEEQPKSKPATVRRMWQPFHSVILHMDPQHTKMTGDGGDTDG